MQRLEVSRAVRDIYIYIYIYDVSRLRVNIPRRELFYVFQNVRISPINLKTADSASDRYYENLGLPTTYTSPRCYKRSQDSPTSLAFP
jgi:hypothetical protein